MALGVVTEPQLVSFRASRTPERTGSTWEGGRGSPTSPDEVDSALEADELLPVGGGGWGAGVEAEELLAAQKGSSDVVSVEKLAQSKVAVKRGATAALGAAALDADGSELAAEAAAEAAEHERDRRAAAAAALAQSAALAVADERLAKTVAELTASVRTSVRLERSHGRAMAEAQREHAAVTEESESKLGALEAKWQAAKESSDAVAAEKLAQSKAAAESGAAAAAGELADVAAEMEAVTDRLAGGGSGRPRADVHVVWLELADRVARLAADHAALAAAAAAAAAAEAEAVAAKVKGPVSVEGLATLGGMADGRGFDRQAYTYMQYGESW